MSQDPGKIPPILDYTGPAGPDPRVVRSRRWGWVIAIASVLVCGFAGVGSDFVRIPMGKKCVLTLVTLIALWLLIHGWSDSSRAYRGWFVVWAIFASCRWYPCGSGTDAVGATAPLRSRLKAGLRTAWLVLRGVAAIRCCCLRTHRLTSVALWWRGVGARRG